MVKVKVVDVMPIEQSDEEKPQPEESKEQVKPCMGFKLLRSYVKYGLIMFCIGCYV